MAGRSRGLRCLSIIFSLPGVNDYWALGSCLQGVPSNEVVVTRRRRMTQSQPPSPLGPIGNAIGVTAVLLVIVFLHLAAFSGNSPFDRGYSSGQPNLPGKTWIIVLAIDGASLYAGYRWLRIQSKANSRD